MLKIAVCDDNHIFLEKFYDCLTIRYGENIEKIDLYTQPQKLLITDSFYDIIFLDIDMPALDGITFANTYDKDAIIIFVTCMDNLVYQAYNNTNSYGFIRKSSVENDLSSVMKKITRFDYYNQFITLQIACDEIEKVKYKDILYIEKYVNSIIVHTKNKEYVERNTLKNISKQLDDRIFVRCHMGYIVNVNYIVGINKNNVQLKYNITIPVSRKNIAKVRRIILGG